MHALWSLLERLRGYRHYARVDHAGICRAFRHCVQTPEGDGWVEVSESRIGWLDRPLPLHARVQRRQRRLGARLVFTN